MTAFQMYSAGQKHGEDSNIPFHDSSNRKCLFSVMILCCLSFSASCCSFSGLLHLSSWLKKFHCYFSKLTVNEPNVHNKRKISLVWSYLVDLPFNNNNAGFPYLPALVLSDFAAGRHRRQSGVTLHNVTWHCMVN